MNRNQKIALGCGIAGCLGLIVLVIAVVVLVALGLVAIPGTSNRNYNYNSNSNSNSNSDSNTDTNSNANSSSSSLSDDDKHKLFQAAATTQDRELTLRVWQKLGLVKANGSPTNDYQQFAQEHIAWAFRNANFIQSINTPEKARAYVDEHFDD